MNSEIRGEVKLKMKKTREDKEQDIITSLQKELDLSDNRVRKHLVIESVKQKVFQTYVGTEFLQELLKKDQAECSGVPPTKKWNQLYNIRPRKVIVTVGLAISFVVLGTLICVKQQKVKQDSEVVVAEAMQEVQLSLGEEFIVKPTQALVQKEVSDSYVIPESNQRYLEESQIKKMTYEQMKLAMYEISARHGRRFYDENIQAYFGGKRWYHAMSKEETYSDALLNEMERSNLVLIKECMDWYEEEHSEAIFDYSLVTIDEMRQTLLESDFTEDEITRESKSKITSMYYSLMELGILRSGKVRHGQMGAI